MLVRSNSRTLSNSVADNSSPDPMAPHTPGIYLLDPSNGAVTGTISLPGPLSLAPIVAGGTMFMVTDNATLLALR